MKPIEQLSQGNELSLARVEDLLRSAADFEPETEATYSFAAAAMARKRFRSRLVWMAAAGCAFSALIVWAVVPRTYGPLGNAVFPPVSYSPAQTEAMAGLGPSRNASGSDVQYSKNVRPEEASLLNASIQRMVDQKRPRFSPARLVSDESRRDSAPLKAKWEDETVEQYGAGVLQPTVIEERNADGSKTLKPAYRAIPIETGERPATGNGADMGVVTLTDYKGDTK